MATSPASMKDEGRTVQRSGTMDFSDACLVMAIALAMFWGVDPFGLQLWRSPSARHIPLVATVGAMVLGAAGRFLNRPDALQELAAAFRTYLALSFVGAFVVAGSLYARVFLNNENTFITIGLYLLICGPFNLWLIATSSAPVATIRSITAVLIGISLLAVAASVMRPGVMIFHSAEHAVLVPVAFPLLLAKRNWLRLIGATLLLAGTLAPNKLTGYIVMLMIFGWVYVDELMTWAAKDSDRVRAGLRVGLGIGAAVLVVILLFLAYESTKSHLADGNLAFRTHNYELAFNRFLDSWIWGRGFAASSVDYFDLFVVNSSTQYLPTHSDPLDILANGGLIAGIPFFVGMGSLILAGWKALDRTRGSSDPFQASLRPHLAMYFLMVVSGISVMALNPVLNQASLAYIFWTASAVMYALVDITKSSAFGSPANAPVPDPLRGNANRRPAKVIR